MPKNTLEVNKYFWSLHVMQNIGDPLLSDYGLNYIDVVTCIC